MIESPWMFLADAAVYARMDQETVRRALASGELRGSQAKRKGKWRTRAEWIDAWIQGETAELIIPRVTRSRAS